MPACENGVEIISIYLTSLKNVFACRHAKSPLNCKSAKKTHSCMPACEKGSNLRLLIWWTSGILTCENGSIACRNCVRYLGYCPPSTQAGHAGMSDWFFSQICDLGDIPHAGTRDVLQIKNLKLDPFLHAGMREWKNIVMRLGLKTTSISTLL
jgi:hypothetical protein